VLCLEKMGLEVGGCDVVADGRATVATALRDLCERHGADLIVTTGGTGLAPRDLTPEATRDFGEREVPGLMELARRRCGEATVFAALSRGVAVTRGRTLIVNLPGNPKAAEETLDAMADVLLHAIQILIAPPEDCRITGSAAEADEAPA
jgi:molybdenum cofactor synthesis domain-containing protein